MTTAFCETTSHLNSLIVQESQEHAQKSIEGYALPSMNIEKEILLSQASDGEGPQLILNDIKKEIIASEQNIQNSEQNDLTEQTVGKEVPQPQQMNEQTNANEITPAEETEEKTRENEETSAKDMGEQTMENEVPPSQEIEGQTFENEVSPTQETVGQTMENDVSPAQQLEEQPLLEREPSEQGVSESQNSTELQVELEGNLGNEKPVEDEQMDVDVDTNQSSVPTEEFQEMQQQSQAIPQEEVEDPDEVISIRMSRKRKSIEMEHSIVQEDPDRMFLLSLMPAMKKIRSENVDKVKRKILKALQVGKWNVDTTYPVTVGSAASNDELADSSQNISNESVPDMSQVVV